MATQVVLLRGINLGARRVAMADLRAALADAGFGEARTYVQSGNIVLSSELASAELATAVRRLLAERFGLEAPVVVRTAEELAEVVAGNPFADQAALNPKQLQVTFRDERVGDGAAAELAAKAGPDELVATVDRETYSWHPDGIARSKLAVALTPAGAAATARNWKTVTTLLEMARDGA